MIRVSYYMLDISGLADQQVSISKRHRVLWTDVSRSGRRESTASLPRLESSLVVYLGEVSQGYPQYHGMKLTVTDTEDRGDEVEGEEDEAGEPRVARKVSHHNLYLSERRLT